MLCSDRWLCPRLLTSMMENRLGVNNVEINQPEINPLIVQERKPSAGLNHSKQHQLLKPSMNAAVCFAHAEEHVQYLHEGRLSRR